MRLFKYPLNNDKKKPHQKGVAFLTAKEIPRLKRTSKVIIIYGMALIAHVQHQQTRLHFQAVHQGEYHGLN